MLSCRLQAELQSAALGKHACQASAAGDDTMPQMQVPQGPTLRRFGDAGNLDPRRTARLLTHEWIICLCCREEMEYDVEGDKEPFRVRANASELEVNRFAQDWVSLHMFATLYTSLRDISPRSPS